ncbi:transcriptional regulator [Clostridiales bacterium PH28_bin88]|nr:transcriptional regulator [Clostridiales bacterium PH28_bin88]
MQEKLKILVADDEERLRRLVRMYLERDGYAVMEASSGEEALARVKQAEFNLLILDVMMPRGDGWMVCREVRKTNDMPIIMLTARGEEVDRVLGFELGADDYVVKPFSPRELVARVKALLRRTSPACKENSQRIVRENLIIDQEAHMVHCMGEPVTLTPKEYDLLVFLARHPGKVFTRENILEQVWGYDFYGDLRTVDTHVKNIREKLGRTGCSDRFISTVWGVGYKFEVEA